MTTTQLNYLKAILNKLNSNNQVLKTEDHLTLILDVENSKLILKSPIESRTIDLDKLYSIKEVQFDSYSVTYIIDFMDKSKSYLELHPECSNEIKRKLINKLDEAVNNNYLLIYNNVVCEWTSNSRTLTIPFFLYSGEEDLDMEIEEANFIEFISESEILIMNKYYSNEICIKFAKFIN